MPEFKGPPGTPMGRRVLDRRNTQDKSGVIAVAGVSQIACPANPSRRSLVISNPDTTTDLFFSTTGPASGGAGSTRLAPDGSAMYDTFVPRGEISVFSAVASKPYTVKEGG